MELNEENVAGMDDNDIKSLPESFAIEYLSIKLKKQLSAMGTVFRKSGLIDENEDEVYAEGQFHDGTTIRIEVRKGENYKSPQDIALEIREEIRKIKENSDK